MLRGAEHPCDGKEVKRPFLCGSSQLVLSFWELAKLRTLETTGFTRRCCSFQRWRVYKHLKASFFMSEEIGPNAKDSWFGVTEWTGFVGCLSQIATKVPLRIIHQMTEAPSHSKTTRKPSMTKLLHLEKHYEPDCKLSERESICNNSQPAVTRGHPLKSSQASNTTHSA